MRTVNNTTFFPLRTQKKMGNKKSKGGSIWSVFYWPRTGVGVIIFQKLSRWKSYLINENAFNVSASKPSSFLLSSFDSTQSNEKIKVLTMMDERDVLCKVSSRSMSFGFLWFSRYTRGGWIDWLSQGSSQKFRRNLYEPHTHVFRFDLLPTSAPSPLPSDDLHKVWDSRTFWSFNFFSTQSAMIYIGNSI